jgi:ring-1,2-phenylacetyl-CoA epoxidase subunit PaaE
MMSEVEEALKNRNVPKGNVNIEYFTPPSETRDGPVQLQEGTSKLKVVLDGDEHDLIVKKNKHILDQVKDEGIDAPFSCMGGVCTTCRAKCMSGEVKMVDAYALSEDEIEDGYILTCSSYAVSDEVYISYDEP